MLKDENPFEEYSNIATFLDNLIEAFKNLKLIQPLNSVSLTSGGNWRFKRRSVLEHAKKQTNITYII